MEHWSALYVKSRNEKKVAERLERKGIEVFCPTQTVVRQWSDRKKKVREPLFRSYVFTRFTKQERLEVLQTPGVVNLVYWLGKPAVIRQEEIDVIQEFLEYHSNAKVRAIDFKVGQEVKVTEGSLADRTGKIIEESKHKLKIQLEQLGLEVFVEVGKASVEQVSGGSSPNSKSSVQA